MEREQARRRKKKENWRSLQSRSLGPHDAHAFIFARRRRCRVENAHEAAAAPVCWQARAATATLVFFLLLQMRRAYSRDARACCCFFAYKLAKQNSRALHLKSSHVRRRSTSPWADSFSRCSIMPMKIIWRFTNAKNAEIFLQTKIRLFRTNFKCVDFCASSHCKLDF